LASIAGVQLQPVNFILLPAGLGKYQIEAEKGTCLLNVLTEG